MEASEVAAMIANLPVSEGTRIGVSSIWERVLPHLSEDEKNDIALIDVEKAVSKATEGTELARTSITTYCSRLKQIVRRRKSCVVASKVYSLPFPVRGDRTILLSGIPYDLTNDEADRLSVFIKSLVSTRTVL